MNARVTGGEEEARVVGRRRRGWWGEGGEGGGKEDSVPFNRYIGYDICLSDNHYASVNAFIIL